LISPYSVSPTGDHRAARALLAGRRGCCARPAASRAVPSALLPSGGAAITGDRDWDGTREPLPAGPDPGITLTCPLPRRPSHL